METSADWDATLARLPQNPQRLPAIYLAHGSPMLLYPKHLLGSSPFNTKIGGPDGPHFQFLKKFGSFLMSTYKPKAIVVFSAHWESQGPIEVTKCDKNLLLYDYYGFPDEMYKITWESSGSPQLADRVVELLKASKIGARALTQERGLDHGVFVPSKIMFPDPLPVPLVQVAIDGSLDPERNIALGRALAQLRSEGVLIISGGLTIHTFRESEAWDPERAPAVFKDFERAIVAAAEIPVGAARNEALTGLTKHPCFRRAHPREEHFVPIYVAAGAGTEGGALVLSKLHGAITIAFGV